MNPVGKAIIAVPLGSTVKEQLSVLHTETFAQTFLRSHKGLYKLAACAVSGAVARMGSAVTPDVAGKRRENKA